MMVKGVMMPTMVTSTPNRAAPTLPAFIPTCQPIRATNSTLGPGAAWARAMAALNCSWVSQPCCSTRKRCISDVVEIAPPTDIIDSSRKWLNRFSQSDQASARSRVCGAALMPSACAR
jgi:hypothetical protein